jgi:hypothetical protein
MPPSREINSMAVLITGRRVLCFFFFSIYTRVFIGTEMLGGLGVIGMPRQKDLFRIKSGGPGVKKKNN